MPGAIRERVCVIGAGPCGITAAKAVLDAARAHPGRYELVVYDRGRVVGGNWVFDAETGHSSVFETTHIISSKRLSQYEDFPMPDGYPDYPGHAELKAYFQSYARHFGVDRVLQLGTEVQGARSRPGGGWTVTLRDGRREEFDALLVASGHHWDPRMPSYPGTFGGELLHSHAYKTAERFAGQRVLVIGGGNSACDIAVETARCSAPDRDQHAPRLLVRAEVPDGATDRRHQRAADAQVPQEHPPVHGQADHLAGAGKEL